MSSRPTRGPSRRQARRAAMMLLYQRSLTERPLEELIARYEEDAGIELPAYGRHLVEDVEAKQPELDAEIDAHAHGWTPDRISPVERAALRIATLELLHRPGLYRPTPCARAIAPSTPLTNDAASGDA